MKFSDFVELIAENKPTDDFYLEIRNIFGYSRFCCFCFNINTEFEILIFLKAPFSRIESLIDAQFAKAFLFFDKCTNFSVILTIKVTGKSNFIDLLYLETTPE